MSVEYLSIDPGGTTGWAAWDERGDPIDFGDVCTPHALYELLDSLSPSVVIAEDYLLYPWKSKEQSWSNLDTVRILGGIEYWCWKTGAKLVLQGANIKSIGYMWAGIKVPKRKADTHKTDAYVHGVYYLQKLGIRKPQQGRAKDG